MSTSGSTAYLFSPSTPSTASTSTPPDAYLPVIAVGLVVGVTSTVILRRSRVFFAVHLLGWLAMAYLVHQGDYRRAVYWSLCVVYSIAAVNFRNRLPRNSTGRLAILTGFIIWALCFFIHPSIVNYPAYADIASHVWNMQKSLISIGMILVMLEEQVSSNQWLALHDELTGLPNRRLFEDRLAHALERSRRTNTPLALLLLDLNGFKKINDSFGHHAGDQVLREIAHNLRETLHTSDTLARIGGDEFVLITSSLADHRSIGHRIDAIQCALERPILLAGRPTIVSASLGTAIYPQDAQDATSLLRTRRPAHVRSQIKTHLPRPKQLPRRTSHRHLTLPLPLSLSVISRTPTKTCHPERSEGPPYFAFAVAVACSLPRPH